MLELLAPLPPPLLPLPSLGAAAPPPPPPKGSLPGGAGVGAGAATPSLPLDKEHAHYLPWKKKRKLAALAPQLEEGQPASLPQHLAQTAARCCCRRGCLCCCLCGCCRPCYWRQRGCCGWRWLCRYLCRCLYRCCCCQRTRRGCLKRKERQPSRQWGGVRGGGRKTGVGQREKLQICCGLCPCVRWR